ncbi:MAG: hypothetical protein WBA44_11635 [Mesorhizobium sp.]
MPNVSTWEKLQNGALFDARPRLYRTSIPLEGQTSGSKIDLGIIPAGRYFVAGILLTDTSLGSATLAIGTADAVGVVGDPTKYRAAATFTTTDVPTLFGKAAATGAVTQPAWGREEIGVIGSGSPYTTANIEEKIVATVGSAALPSSGTLVVTLVFSGT